MRSIIVAACLLASTAAFGQSVKVQVVSRDVARQLYELDMRFAHIDPGAVLMRQSHVTLDGLNDFWMKQADAGKELTMPYLVVSHNSSKGDVGRLPNGPIGCMEFQYILLRQDSKSSTVECNRYRDGLRESRIEVTFHNANTKSVFDGGVWEPVGYWQITGIESGKLVIELLPDGEVKFPDVRYHFITSKEKPRDWSTKDGKTKFTGIYLGYDNPTIWVLVDNEIQKRDLFTMSESDQAFVRKELKAGRIKHYLRKLEPEKYD